MNRAVVVSKKPLWIVLAVALVLHTGLISLQARHRINTGFVRERTKTRRMKRLLIFASIVSCLGMGSPSPAIAKSSLPGALQARQVDRSFGRQTHIGHGAS